MYCLEKSTWSRRKAQRSKLDLAYYSIKQWLESERQLTLDGAAHRLVSEDQEKSFLPASSPNRREQSPPGAALEEHPSERTNVVNDAVADREVTRKFLIEPDPRIADNEASGSYRRTAKDSEGGCRRTLFFHFMAKVLENGQRKVVGDAWSRLLDQLRRRTNDNEELADEIRGCHDCAVYRI